VQAPARRITSRLSSMPAINGSGRRYQANTLTLRTNESISFAKQIGFISARKGARCVWRPSKIGGNAIEMRLADTLVEVTIIPHGEVSSLRHAPF
jgi:hypothetical protein